jgi:methionyl aminopeptidase
VIIIKNAKQIEGIKKSSLLAAHTLKYLSEYVKPGVSTQKLNDLAHQYILDHGATPAPLNYGGFPKSICSSVNDVVCHGIPSPKHILKDGDIINLDITTILDGYYGDTSATFPVGKISPAATKLLKVTQDALYLSIKSLKPGKYLNDCVGAVIEPFVQKYGYSVVRDLGGHGVGLEFHEDPFVFHFDTGRRDILLKPGMIFTVEPMINNSPNYQIKIDSHDGWTVTTRDGSLSAQFEHTVLITPVGVKILTKL